MMEALPDRETAPVPASDAVAPPVTEEAIDAAAAALGLSIPAACRPGVIANMALLARHAAILRGDAGPA